MDLDIGVGTSHRDGQRAVEHAEVLLSCHHRLDFRHRDHQRIHIWHLESCQLNQILRLVESAEQHRVFIHLILKHILLINARTTCGRADGCHLIVDVYRLDTRGFQLVDASGGSKVVVVKIVNAEIERFLHRDKQPDLALVTR